MNQVATMSERDYTSSSDGDYRFERRINLSKKPVKFTEGPLFVRKPRDWSLTRDGADLAMRREAAGAVSQEGAVRAAATPELGGWMSNGGTHRMSLTEAASRLDENGNLRPRSRPSLARPKRNVERQGVSEDQIPRTTSFDSEAGESVSLSPPRTEPHTSRGREGRAASAPTVNYESEDTDAVRQGSPSPGPRNGRWSDRRTTASAPPESGGWMSNGGTYRMSLTEAAARLDGNGNLRLRTRPNLAEREEPLGSSKEGTQSDLGHANTGLGAEMSEWNADLEFTAQSLQISTSPQLRIKKSSKLDEIRSREIQDLSARAVATSRLEEIRERNSEERSFNSDSRVNTQDLTSSSKQEPAPEEYHMSILEEEGEKIPHTPITVFRAKDFEAYCKRNNISFSSSRSRSNSGSSGEGDPSESNWKQRFPKTSRVYQRKLKEEEDEQRDVLRKLSRAVSVSPTLPITEEEEEQPVTRSGPAKKDMPSLDAPDLDSPTYSEPVKIAENVRSDSIKTNTSESETKKSEDSKPSDPISRLKTPDLPTSSSKSDVDPEERITAEAMLFELQDNKSERNSIRVPSPAPSDDGQFDETPRPKPDPLSLPTPRITGAYIETPAPITRVRRKSRSASPTESVTGAPETVKKSKSELITAALTERYRNQKKSKSRNTSFSPEPQGRFRDARPPLINTAKPVSVAEDLRQIQGETQVEDPTLDNFDALLEAEAEAEAGTEGQTAILEPVVSLEYDERGLPLSEKEIERRIERLTLDRMNQSLKATSTSIRDARHGIERLEEQVSSAFVKIAQPEDGTTYVNIKIPVPRLYVTHPPEKPGLKPSWKFTWLGLILSLFLAWYVSESAMCAQFCHPIASNKNTWQPSDPFFPWAIPTKLDQWTGEVVSSGLDGMAKSLGFKKGFEPWNWNLIASVPRGYKGGPISADDWWLGRNGPVGIVHDEKYPDEGMFDDDEMI